KIASGIYQVHKFAILIKNRPEYFDILLKYIIVNFPYVRTYFLKLINLLLKDVLYEIEPLVIFEIFLKGMFLDIDPILLIETYNEYYESSIKYIIFLYIQTATGVIDDDTFIPSLTEQMLNSNRYKLFEDGIKLSQIYILCNESEVLKRINSNITDIKTKILPNDFQKLYSIIVEKNVIYDSKLLTLKYNLDMNKELDSLKEQTPLIYKLLRSIKIFNNKKKFSYYERALIKNIIYESVFIKITPMIGEEYSTIMAESISKNLEYSLTNGEFIDPYTLSILAIDTKIFIPQFKDFLSIILNNLEIKELDYV
ncbi:MAG: hypothetical protein IPH62_19535, partial [Ignavibacteriae bacterium]|nr:hypothetical protein [Ignavibacteriota bacterium]